MHASGWHNVSSPQSRALISEQSLTRTVTHHIMPPGLHWSHLTVKCKVALTVTETGCWRLTGSSGVCKKEVLPHRLWCLHLSESVSPNLGESNCASGYESPTCHLIRDKFEFALAGAQICSSSILVPLIAVWVTEVVRVEEFALSLVQFWKSPKDMANNHSHIWFRIFRFDC